MKSDIKVCKKCWGTTKDTWVGGKSRLWKAGEVCCVENFLCDVGDAMDVPDSCLFLLEYIVSQDVE